jgi:uncharacterized protein YecE (DUF72 family)
VGVRIGTSGWQYRHWRGVLYPARLPQHAWLARYAALLDTVEVNATFYRLASAAAAGRWRAATPAGFTFAVKGSRYLTHMKALLEPAKGVRRFFAPLAPLGAKLGPVLWQLPARAKADPGRLDAFLGALPPGRHAVELRDPAWHSDATLAILDRHGAALCEHDLAPPAPRTTGGWRYLRFHGATGRYDGAYGPARLAPVARELARFAAEGGEAWVYFNNDLGGHAVRDALALRALLRERPRAAEDAAHLA